MATGFPLGEDARILGAALGSTILPEEDIAAPADRVGQGDDSLSRLLVETIRGDMVCLRHGSNPFCGRLPQLKGSRAAPSTEDGYA